MDHWWSTVLSIFPFRSKSATHHFHYKCLHLNWLLNTCGVRAGYPLNWQVTWRESLTWRSVLCVTSRQTPSQPFRRVSLQTLASHRRGRVGDNPAPVVSAGFISYIVEPLFDEWHRFTEPSLLSRTMMGHLHQNQARWSRLRHARTSLGAQTDHQVDEPAGSAGEDGEDIP